MMKNETNKNTIITVLIVIVIILSILVVLFAIDTINFSFDKTNNNKLEQNISDNDIVENNDKDSSIFGGEYIYNLSTGAKVYTDYTSDGSFYYKRVELDNTISTYGYGIYTINENILTTKIVFGIDMNNNSIVKSIVSESTYKINNDSIEYDASGTSGQNHFEEKISNDCNISKEVTSYLYKISKNNENKNNFIYE